MVVGAIGERTDVAVIGGGPGGYVAALRAADAGLDVTLVERDRLGGTCLNVGCIPSKALIEIAGLNHRGNHARGLGLTGWLTADAESITRHLGTIAAGLRAGVASLLAGAGVTVMPGTANFARADRLAIEHEDAVAHLEFEHAIVATGSRPVELANFAVGSADGRVMDSTGALSLDFMPASMAILGAGYIGIELGTAWSKLGVAVTVIEAAPTILGRVDPALRAPVERRLRELGVQVRSRAQAVEPTSRGVRLADGAEIEAQVIVVAVGRRPNSDRCSLELVGVESNADGHVLVDRQQRAAAGIYAIGDLVPGPALAHKATAEAEIAVDALLGRATVRPSVVPEVIFSDPEIMSVGVTIAEAAGQGLHTHHFPHSASARAGTLGAASGFTAVVTDDAQTVVGVHAVGPHASELAGEASLAIEMAATLDDLTLTVHPHPTMSETLAEAAWLAKGAPLHVRR